MANVAKLKERARALEQREQWKEALDLYLQAIEEGEGEEVEIGLWNRIGDIHLRVGQSDRAVEAYDRAVDAYSEAGLYNNAIALCRKILRIAPARAAVYLKLGQISAAQGFLADARQNFLEYATRMQRAGQLDASFSALKEFADLSPEDTDIRLALADQLRSHGRDEEAVEQLRILLAHLRESGDEAAVSDVEQRILAVDPDADLTVALPSARDGDEAGGADGSGLDYGEITLSLPDSDLEVEATLDDTDVAEVQPLADLELPGIGADLSEISALEGLETSEEYGGWGGQDEEDADAEALPLLDAGIEPTRLDEAPLADITPAAPLRDEPLWEMDAPAEDEDDDGSEAEPLPLLDFEPPPPAPAAADPFGWGTALPEPARDPLDELRERVASAPDDTVALHRLVDLLEERGQAAEAEGVLAAAHRDLGARGLYREAIDTLRSLLARRPADTLLFQKQVEYAFRAGDTQAMVRAYLDLGRHLGLPGENPKSRAVYQRVLELDPGNAEALRVLAPPPPAAPAPVPAGGGSYVDLGSLILDDEPDERSTRFVVEEEEPTGDEDRDFADMLAVFKQKVTENIGAEDSSSHYDLGVAFMEMGLVDEAIAEFQVALRGGASPLATLEMLGRCFVEKGQHAVAVRVLERALRLPGASEAEMVGVVYQLGRSQEALGNAAGAREAYERVLAFDIRFRDTADRLEALRDRSTLSGF